MKQKEVCHVISENNLSICAILESHVAKSHLEQLCSKVFWNWKWTSNGGLCEKGPMIILGWNPDDVDVSIIAQTSQVMHTKVTFKADHKILFCYFIYAHNRYYQRLDLWYNLGMYK